MDMCTLETAQSNPKKCNDIILIISFQDFSLQCFDTVGWATGRASGLQKVGCWFVGGDDLT